MTEPIPPTADRTPLEIAHERLQALYDRLPALDCQRLCKNTCGPIPMTGPEYQRIAARTGYQPKLKAGESVCPLLNRKRALCRVYEMRPLVCRLWGLIEGRACPHGCTPERFLTLQEAEALLEEYRQIEADYLAATTAPPTDAPNNAVSAE